MQFTTENQPEHRGRKPGSKNKSNERIREAIALVTEGKADQLQSWLEAIDDPAEKIKVYLQMCSYCIPKMRSVEMVTPEENIITVNWCEVKSND